METFFNLDKIMFDLVEGSGFVLIFILGVLKVFAKRTKFTEDDEIIGMLLGMFRKVKEPRKKAD